MVLVPLRSAPRRREVDAWGLVLASQSIPFQMFAGGGEWTIAVEEGDLGRAEASLAAFERENRPRLEAAGAEERPHGLWLGAGLGAAILLSSLWIGPWDGRARVFERGAADARLILDGQLWRVLTALTLHSGYAHAVGNAVSAGLFATALGRALGPGLALLVLVAAGALGNTATAAWHGSLHLSVGASTSLFGAIGALAALQARRRWRASWRGRAWLPLAGGIALLAMLGTGERSDLAAHVFGLAAGALLGALAVPLPERAAGRLADAGCAGLALAALAWAWAVALEL